MSTNKFLTIVSGVQRLVQGVTSSAGAGDANKLISTNSSGKLDSTFLPAGVELQAETIVTSETLAAGDFVNVYDNSGTRTARKADASNGRMANGYVLSASTSGQNATVYKTGKNSGLTSLTAGQQRFLSATTPGASTATAPSTAGQMRQSLGWADSSTSILFEFDEPIYLDA